MRIIQTNDARQHCSFGRFWSLGFQREFEPGNIRVWLPIYTDTSMFARASSSSQNFRSWSSMWTSSSITLWLLMTFSWFCVWSKGPKRIRPKWVRDPLLIQSRYVCCKYQHRWWSRFLTERRIREQPATYPLNVPVTLILIVNDGSTIDWIVKCGDTFDWPAEESPTPVMGKLPVRCFFF